MNDFSLIYMAIELLRINEDFSFRLENPTNTRISDLSYMTLLRYGEIQLVGLGV